MLIISNHLLSKQAFDFPDHAVVRVNIAWLNSSDELVEVLSNIKHDVYLDYPQGRTKPPRPKLTIDEALDITPRFANIKYFAVSNVEDPDAIHAIRTRLPVHVELIPKIETKKGIENLEAIIERIGASHIMLDKEDLYMDVERDSDLFEKLVETTREKCRRCGVKALELHGVVFLPHEST